MPAREKNGKNCDEVDGKEARFASGIQNNNWIVTFLWSFDIYNWTQIKGFYAFIFCKENWNSSHITRTTFYQIYLEKTVRNCRFD